MKTNKFPLVGSRSNILRQDEGMQMPWKNIPESPLWLRTKKEDVGFGWWKWHFLPISKPLYNNLSNRGTSFRNIQCLTSFRVTPSSLQSLLFLFKELTLGNPPPQVHLSLPSSSDLLPSPVPQVHTALNTHWLLAWEHHEPQQTQDPLTLRDPKLVYVKVTHLAWVHYPRCIFIGELGIEKGREGSQKQGTLSSKLPVWAIG